MDDVSDVMMELFYFYCKSPKRLSHLREVARIMEVSVTKSLKCHGTRWIQHKLNACQALQKSFKAITIHLEIVANDKLHDSAKAKGILNRLISTKFVLHLLYFIQLLEPVSRVSLA